MEWIIIDDGSSDQTFELIAPWIEVETSFEIIYLRVKNGGKHRAINKASDLARGDLFFIVDSDDYLTEDAIEKIIKWEQTIQGQSGYAGIAGNKGVSESQLIGHTFKGDYIDATSLEREKYQIEGDKAEVFYTSILKKYKFPEIEGENFITEAVVWFQIAADNLKIRWFNDIIYIANYLEDGLTKNSGELVKNNPKGAVLTAQLYEKYYEGFLLKEKEEAIEKVKNLLVGGDLIEVITYLDQLMPRLKKEIEIQLMYAQVMLYAGKTEIAKDILKQLQFIYPRDASAYLKLAEITEREGNRLLAIKNYQKSLLYLDESQQEEPIRKLKQNYRFTQEQLDRLTLALVKHCYKQGEIEQAKQLVLRNPIIDECYKLELYYYWNNNRLCEYIIGFILNLTDEKIVNAENTHYVQGHILFNKGDYEQSLQSLFHLSPQQLTPLSLYRIAWILKLRGNEELAKKYDSTYQLVCQQIKATGQIYFVEEIAQEPTSPTLKFRQDMNTIFKEMGFKSIQSNESRRYTFSIFDIIFFQYPIVSGCSELFSICCSLNLKIVLIVNDLVSHNLNQMNEIVDVLNQASYLITCDSNLNLLLLEYGCYRPIYCLEGLDYLMNFEAYKKLKEPQLSNKVVLVDDFELLSKLNDHHFEVNLYGKSPNKFIKGEKISYKGDFSLDELPFVLDGSFGLVSPDTQFNSWKISLYLLVKLPIICFAQSRLASFVLENHLGLVISDVNEIDQRLSQILIEDYQKMVQNMNQYYNNRYQDVSVKQAIDDILKQLNKH